MACAHEDTVQVGDDGRGYPVLWCRDCGAIDNGDEPLTWELPRRVKEDAEIAVERDLAD